MEGLQLRDPVWYNKLVGVLNEEQKKTLNEVYVLALQRKAAAGLSLLLSQSYLTSFEK